MINKLFTNKIVFSSIALVALGFFAFMLFSGNEFGSATPPKIDTLSDFSVGQSPIFEISSALAADEIKSAVRLYDTKNKQMTDFDVEVIELEGDKKQVKINPKGTYSPGEYTLHIHEGDLDIVQDFTWGVLAINTNKAAYTPNETVNFDIAVLDEQGGMECGANLELYITNPSGNTKLLQTTSNSIKVNKQVCYSKEMQTEPDYFAEYKASSEGIYKIYLKAKTKNGEYIIEDYFEVSNNLPFEIERVTQTRIYPLLDYPVEIKIKANKDFKGKITEYFPASFKITESDADSVEQQMLGDGSSRLKMFWEVDIKRNQTITLRYTYDAPDISPYFHLLGPLEFKEHCDETPQQRGDCIIYTEPRAWQIASDDIESMRPSADNTDGAWTAATGSDLFEMINDDPDSPTDTNDYIIAPNKTDQTSYSTFIELSAPPAGFTTATNLDIKVRHQEEGSGGDFIDMYYRLYESDTTTALSAEVSSIAIPQGTWTDVAYSTVTISGTNDFDTWDGALLAVRQIHDQNAGPDTTSRAWVSAVEVNLTYTPEKIVQDAYIFENDDGANVNSNTDMADANLPITNIKKGQRLIGRIQLANEGTGGLTKTYQLQYDRNDGIWNNVDFGGAPSGNTASASEWQDTIVDNSTSVGQYTSMSLGADGFPVISYYSAVGALKVVKCNDVACTGGDETDSTVDSASLGVYTSLAIGTDGNPVISYYDWGGNTSLWVAKCNDPACAGGDETITEVDNAEDDGSHSYIAIGADGFPIIAYRDETANNLKVTHCTNESCSSFDSPVTVDSGTDVGTFVSIAIGIDGFPVIAYRDIGNTALKVIKCNDAACDGTGETTTTVDNTEDDGWYNSIAIGTDGFPIISYYDNTNSALKVAHCTNASCSTSDTAVTVDNAANVGLHTSIAIGTDGLPIISHQDGTSNNNLKLTKCNDVKCSGGDETNITINTGTDVGQYTSLAIAPDGYPIISYYDVGNTALSVTKLMPNSEITPSWALSGASDDNLTARAAGACQTTSSANGEFYEVANKSGSITIANDTCLEIAFALETSEAAPGTTYRLRLVEDNGAALFRYDEYPTFTIEDNNKKKVFKDGTTCDVANWECYTISHGSDEVNFQKIAIGTDGLPVIAARNSTDSDLLVIKCNDITCSGDNETVTEVAHADTTGQRPNIAISGDGYPIIVHYNSTDGDLMITKCNNDSCSTNSDYQLTDADDIGNYPAVVLGADGLPIIAYYNSTDGDLTIMKCNDNACSGGDDTITQISDSDDVGLEPSIAIGNDTFPVISFRDGTNGDLMVVKCTSQDCTTYETPTKFSHTDSTGWNSSIIIGNDGFPVIAHRNSTDGELMVTACDDIACDGTGDTTTQVRDGDADNLGLSPMILLGDDHLPVIGHINITDKDITITKCTNTTCTSSFDFKVVDGVNTIGTSFGMTIGTDGKLITAYSNLATPDVTHVAHKLYDFNLVTVNDESRRYSKEDVLITGNCTDTGYECTTAYNPASVGSNVALVIGADGFPIIANKNNTDGDLVVTKCNDAACVGGDETTSVVDDTSANLGIYTSMAIGTDGFPVISYYDITNTSLKVAKCNDIACTGGDETLTTVDNTDASGLYTSIAIGTDGFPVVSYFEAGANTLLKVVHCTNVSCSTFDTPTTVDNAADVGWFSSIVIGTDGFPVVSYSDNTNTALKVAHCTNVSCSTFDSPTTVDNAASTGTFNDIAIGIDGFPIISYSQGSTAAIKVTHCTNVSCSTFDSPTTINTDANQHTSIAIGTDGFPVIAYKETGSNNLKSVNCTNVSCSTSDTAVIVDSTATDIGAYNDIKVGTDGLPIIAYTDTTNTSLKVAKMVGLPTTGPAYFDRAKRQIKFHQDLDTDTAPQYIEASPFFEEGLKYWLDLKGYSNVTKDDTSRDEIVAGTTESPMFEFIDKHTANDRAPSAVWVGQSTVAASTNNIVLQVFRFGSTNAWETITTETGCGANSDCTIDGDATGTASDYYFYRPEYDASQNSIDDAYFVYWRIYQTVGAQTLKTDFWNPKNYIFNITGLNFTGINFE